MKAKNIQIADKINKIMNNNRLTAQLLTKSCMFAVLSAPVFLPWLFFDLLHFQYIPLTYPGNVLLTPYTSKLQCKHGPK